MAVATSTQTFDIKPDGTGDYTTLAAWWAANNTGGAGNAVAPHARCYRGGDLGALQIDYWAEPAGFTPTATYYSDVYAAAGEGHDGIAGTGNGAYTTGNINVNLAYTRVRGLRSVVTLGSPGFGAVTAGADNARLDGLLIELDANANNSHGIRLHTTAAGTYGMLCQNCLVFVDATGTGTGIQVYATAGVTINGVLYHNTVHQTAGANYGIELNANGAGATVNGWGYNNIATGFGTDYKITTAAGGAASWNTVTHNCSSDATDPSTADGLTNQTPASLFKAPGTDHNLLGSAAAKYAGTSADGVTTDAIGNAYGTTPSMGALAYVAAAAGLLLSRRSRARSGLGAMRGRR